MVAADYFQVMGVTPILGRAFIAEDDRPGANPVTVISYGFWQKYFAGDSGVVGKTIALDDRAFNIIGVMLQALLTRDRRLYGYHWSYGMEWQRRPHSGTRDRAVEAGGNDSAGARGHEFGGATISARASGGKRGRESRQRPFITGTDHRRCWSALWILFGAVVLVLFIACANVANLLLARAPRDERNSRWRAAFGATRARIIRQLLIESLLLALLGGTGGL